MTDSNARPGFGVTLQYHDGGSPGSYIDVAEITGIPGVGTTVRTSEVTHMQSPGGWAEHIGTGVREGKSFTVPVNFIADDTSHVLLFQTRSDGSRNEYRITFTDVGTTTLTFNAIVTESDISHERDSHATGSITFLPSGAFTWA